MAAKFSEIVNRDQPVLVDFHAEWCGPCKMMTHILKNVKSSLGDSVKIIKIDVDKNNQLAREYNVRGVPTLILFHKGMIKWKQSGIVQAAQLTQLIQKYI